MSHRRIAAWLALTGALGTLLLAGPTTARACNADTVDIDRIVGFQEDGHYVTFAHHYNSYSEDIPDESFTLNDADGVVLATLEAVWDEGANVTRWRSSGSAFFDGLASTSEDASKIEEAVVAAKQLTTSTKKRKVRHVKNERTCGSIELKTKSGWLRVFERHENAYGGCHSFGLEAFEHPKTHVVFIRAKRKARNADFSTEVDTIVELSSRTVDAIELALRAERERLAGDVDEAITYLEASIAAAPEYVPARMSLVRAYARAGREWEGLLAWLDRPIPEGTSIIGAAPDDAALRALIEKTWPGASVPEELAWYQRDPQFGPYWF